jgi:type I restriction enzyme, S subunit
MMANWSTRRIEEVCEVTSSKRIYATELVAEGVPFLKSKEIIEKVSGQAHTNLLYISEQRFQQIEEQTGSIEEDDVLLTSRGTLGVPYVVTATDRFHFADGNLTWFRRLEGLDSNYLRYFFLSPSGKAELSKCVIGSSQQAYTIAALKKAEIPLPPLPIQRRIAGILSAYDELIENSQRRIKILESMARGLYREWFVHFRFPGHESVPRVPSTLGEIPKGWEGTIRDIASIERKGINPFDFPGEQFEHFSIPAFDDGRMPAVEVGASIRSNKYCIDHRCVLLSKLNPRIPRVWLPSPTGTLRAITSTEFLVLTPIAGFSREFIYAKFCSDEFVGQFASQALGTSTSHQRVRPENVLAMPSIVPDRAVVESFRQFVAPMLSMSEQLRTKIQNLRRTRDLLLPRLLSGQIDVEAIGL